MKRSLGFTLIELAIVLVIIGLIIAGIILGTTLQEAAKKQKVISELQQHTIAIRLFKERYGYFPGDVPGAAELFNAGSTGGNGNHVVEWFNLEMGVVWAHMYEAGLSSFYADGIVPMNIGGIPDTEKLIPLSAFKNRGFYWFGAIPNSAYGNTVPESSYFMIAGHRDIGCTSCWSAKVTPQDAYDIDRKIDDGVPNHGLILASGGYLQSNLCLVSQRDRVISALNEVYDLTTATTPECRLFYLSFR